jgi:hypothetical protein
MFWPPPRVGALPVEALLVGALLVRALLLVVE